MTISESTNRDHAAAPAIAKKHPFERQQLDSALHTSERRTNDCLRSDAGRSDPARRSDTTNRCRRQRATPQRRFVGGRRYGMTSRQHACVFIQTPNALSERDAIDQYACTYRLNHAAPRDTTRTDCCSTKSSRTCSVECLQGCNTAAKRVGE